MLHLELGPRSLVGEAQQKSGVEGLKPSQKIPDFFLKKCQKPLEEENMGT